MKKLFVNFKVVMWVKQEDEEWKENLGLSPEEEKEEIIANYAVDINMIVDCRETRVRYKDDMLEATVCTLLNGSETPCLLVSVDELTNLITEKQNGNN